MWQDPIVAEVRQTRRQLEEECGNTFEGIFRAAREIQQRYKGEVVEAGAVEDSPPGGTLR